jgi:hemoglobin-like flavoprotein
MGGDLSSLYECVCFSDNVSSQDASSSVYPSFYVTCYNFTVEDLNCVRDSWSKIENATGLHFIKLKSSPDFKYSSLMKYFWDNFLDKLHDRYPSISNLLLSSECTCRFMKTIGNILDIMDNSNEIHTALIGIALHHAKNGVHAIQYGLFGEIFLQTLQHCLAFQFTEYTKESWIKVNINIFCYNMLTIISVTSIDFEFHVVGHSSCLFS